MTAVLATGGAVDALNRSALDAAFRHNRESTPQPLLNDVVVVGIDEAFLEKVDEPLALSHAYLARFLRIMVAARPAVVGLDLVLPEKRFNTLAPVGNPDLDFHRMLLTGLLEASQALPLVVAKAWDQDRGHYRDIQVDYVSVLEMQDIGIEPIASVLLCLDPDDRIRNYPGSECQPDASNATFASEISAAAGKRQLWSGLIDYQLGGEFTYIPLQEVLQLAQRRDTRRLAQLFTGKPVMLGAVLDETDLVDVPVALAEWRPGNRRVPGVLVHAQIVRSMLNTGFVQPIAPAWLVFLASLFGSLWFVRRAWLKFLLFALASACLVLASCLMLRQGHWMPPGAVLLAGLVACVASSLLTGRRNFRERQVVNRTFAGHVGPEILQKIQRGTLETGGTGRDAQVCVLCCELRGLSVPGAEVRAEDKVALLNRYLEPMAMVIHRHGGTVDKLLGDGLTAFFGAPAALASPEQSAIESAHEIVLIVDAMEAQGSDAQRPAVRVRIGLHSGRAVTCYLGNAGREQYTAIGTAVEVAESLLSAVEDDDYSIVCTEAVADALGRPAILAGKGAHRLRGGLTIELYGWNPVNPVVLALQD